MWRGAVLGPARYQNRRNETHTHKIVEGHVTAALSAALSISYEVIWNGQVSGDRLAIASGLITDRWSLPSHALVQVGARDWPHHVGPATLQGAITEARLHLFEISGAPFIWHAQLVSDWPLSIRSGIPEFPAACTTNLTPSRSYFIIWVMSYRYHRIINYCCLTLGDDWWIWSGLI